MITITKTSVVICTKNRPLDLIKCMDSLALQTYPIFELIIIDSGDSGLDNIIEKYKNISNIKYIKYKASLTAARNIGIKESNGDIILFLDDDVILSNDYIYNIIRIFEVYGEHIGAVSGSIINEEIRSKIFSNLIRYSLIREFRNLIFRVFFLNCIGDGKFQPSGLPTYPRERKKILFIQYLEGANMAFRKGVLNRFKFDENLHGYCFMEDCDISYRISQQYKIIYTPYAKLYHNVSPASRDSDRLRMKMLIENHYYLFNKNFPHTLYNRFTFWVSVFGLFFISILELNKEGLKGLFSGFRAIMSRALRDLIIPRDGISIGIDQRLKK